MKQVCETYCPIYCRVYDSLENGANKSVLTQCGYYEKLMGRIQGFSLLDCALRQDVSVLWIIGAGTRCQVGLYRGKEKELPRIRWIRWRERVYHGWLLLRQNCWITEDSMDSLCVGGFIGLGCDVVFRSLLDSRWLARVSVWVCIAKKETKQYGSRRLGTGTVVLCVKLRGLLLSVATLFRFLCWRSMTAVVCLFGLRVVWGSARMDHISLK
jgi:hypothetical protein